MKKITLSTLIYIHIFFILLVLIGINIFSNVNIKNDDIVIISTFVINGAIIVKELFRPTRLGYSLYEIVYIYFFIFMFFSPLVQYLSDMFPWENASLITNSIILKSNFMIFVFLIVYKIVYFMFKKRNYEKNYKVNKYFNNLHLILNILYLLTIVVSMYIIALTGISNLFARSTNYLNIVNQGFSLIIQNSFRAIPVFYVGINLMYYQKNKRIYKKIPFLIGLLFALVINFPTATARFWAGSIYIGFLIILIRKLKNPYLFKIIIMLGLFVVFPLLNIFRVNSFSNISDISISIPNPADAFLVGDYDSYSMLARAIIFAQKWNITYGRQLLGNLLFFIPRSYWLDKPIGSGVMIAESYNWQFSNVSMPFIGEGYINFGFFGIIIFAFFLALITSKADYSYENNLYKTTISVTELIYPFSLGFLFFIMRGDLLSSLSYYIGFLIPVFLILMISKIPLKT